MKNYQAEFNFFTFFFMKYFRLLKRENRGREIQTAQQLSPPSSLAATVKNIPAETMVTPPIVSATTASMKILLTFALLVSTLPVPIFSEAMDIRQEMYRVNMPVTQNVSHETFVIDGDLTPGRLPGGQIPLSTCYKLPAVHFKFGSSNLAPAEGNSLLAALKQLGVPLDTPLVITGYTCKLGPDHYNRTLSLQRARAVADFLQAHGFTVATVQGKGPDNPLTHKPQELYRNRRVEIELTR